MSTPGEGFPGGKKGVVVVRKAERQSNKGRQASMWKSAVTAAATVFVVAFLSALLVLGWVASAVLGIFMAFFVGLLVLEAGGETRGSAGDGI